ncbi:hypothetical protein Vadar_008339 [Vaccinium darrowii]|uniref:Uncharacterized protein n=1 Tax=Vaccinium darrowii TaxID=229202 RepID=A0ACB7XXL2_9ERIC|nr:hypothetical protein Vadar_008339 [Vaccinium darrowii]
MRRDIKGLLKVPKSDWKQAQQSLRVSKISTVLALISQQSQHFTLFCLSFEASSVGGRKHSVKTDYVLKVLGLDVCSDTIVGNDMLRGVSVDHGYRLRLSAFWNENECLCAGYNLASLLDSSTTFQIVKCMWNAVHQMEATVLMALLQPAPETFDLFDDLVVTSRKDQAQYWADSSKPYKFLPVSEIAEAFKNSKYGMPLKSTLSVPYDKSKNQPATLSKTKLCECGKILDRILARVGKCTEDEAKAVLIQM